MIENAAKLPEMEPVIVEHKELKLIGIPCIGLNDMGDKYRHAKEALLSSAKHLPHIVNPQIHYGLWPHGPSQSHPDTHVYILCMEVESYDGIPEWFLRLTLPAQRCVVVANKDGDFEAASQAVEAYLREKGLQTSAGERSYTICERYSYEGEGFARYSLPLID
ncbi:effector binding domain-containing protein [Paenibacillus ehimensis]|uniref:GyrI-like domain-containing protein n=1 Tax=Paenibacillus ehimensis TaxID=79264 RepID=UPI002DBCECC7|nr:effector binding domain-containing protein [Paenibacillus ehimensis]MEC0210696.1 effector binding domain-containing protein [Paenibacillus ehimensis]